MRALGLVVLVAAVPLSLLAQDEATGSAPSSDPVAAFVDVVKVLQSPRCVNCHPNGDVPNTGDDATPHAMQVRRGLQGVGMSCQTCHRATPVSTEKGLPPAVPGWGMPPRETPMVFQGKTASELCAQLKDPAQNGGKDLAGLLHHVEADALVLYGWNPGGGRTLPPLSHADFVARFRTWVQAGGPCP
ncbi:MAG: hypothetical protein AB2A00_15395 [Myxococcota bacterium]